MPAAENSKNIIFGVFLMAHEFETGFFVKEPAWHKLGTVLSEAPTIAEGIIKAGLDWQVLERPVYSQDDRGNFNQAPNHKAFIRSSDNSTLGIVSKNYKPLQNIDAFNWFDFLLNEGDATLDAAGSLKSGRKVWILAKINNTSLGEVRDDDVVNPYGGNAEFGQNSTLRLKSFSCMACKESS
jgi:phage/plasmid-like protein (TIGR03299 family)